MPHMVDPQHGSKNNKQGGICQHVDELGRCFCGAHVVVRLASGGSTFYTRRCLFHYVALENLLRNNPAIKILDAKVIPRDRVYITQTAARGIHTSKKMTGYWKRGKHKNKETGEWE